MSVLFRKRSIFVTKFLKGKKRLRYFVLRIHGIKNRNFVDKVCYSIIYIFRYEKKKSLFRGERVTKNKTRRVEMYDIM
jgi:hypothetical protein